MIKYVIHVDTHKYPQGSIIEDEEEARALMSDFPLCIGRIEVPDAPAKKTATKTIQNKETHS